MSTKEGSRRGIISSGQCRGSVDESEPWKELPSAALGLALIWACGQSTASAEQPAVSSEPVSKTFSARVAGVVGNSALDDPALDDKTSEAELRRGYGIVDMRINSCVSRENDYTIVGVGCPPGFFIYGPYVLVPGNSEIEVSFEVKSSKDSLVYADIVSQMGRQTLAGLNRQRVAAGQLMKLGYRVHVFNADANVESRIGLDAEPDTAFEITNLTMTVR